MDQQQQRSVGLAEGEVLTLPEAAEYVKVSYERAAKLLRRDTLPAFGAGRRVRLCRHDLEGFMRRRGVQLCGRWQVL